MTVGTGKLLRGTVATFVHCITCGSQETGVEAWGGPSAFIAALLLTCSSLWFDRGHREALTNSLEDTFMNRNRQQAEKWRALVNRMTVSTTANGRVGCGAVTLVCFVLVEALEQEKQHTRHFTRLTFLLLMVVL